MLHKVRLKWSGITRRWRTHMPEPLSPDERLEIWRSKHRLLTEEQKIHPVQRKFPSVAPPVVSLSEENEDVEEQR